MSQPVEYTIDAFGRLTIDGEPYAPTDFSRWDMRLCKGTFTGRGVSAPLCRCGKTTVFVRHQDAAPVGDDEWAASDVRSLECDMYRCECGLWHAVDLSPPPSEEVRKLLAEYVDKAFTRAVLGGHDL